MSFQQIQNTGVGTNTQSVGPITPLGATDLLIATTSFPSTTPAGITGNFLGTSFTWDKQVTNTNPITWTGTGGGGGNTTPWAAVVMDFATLGTVALGNQTTVNFGTGATQTPVITTNAGDTIIVAIPNTPATSSLYGAITISDNKGNVYTPICNPLNSISIPQGTASQLWMFVASVTTSGATTLTLTLANWSATFAPNGSIYTLTNLAPIPPTLFFQAAPTSIPLGQSSTLNWVITGAQSASIDHGVGAEPLSGSTIVSPITTTTYTLSAITNSLTVGTATATVQVTVNNAAFNLQKLVLWLKEASVPVRGRNQ